MTSTEPDEELTPCADPDCLHPLKDHLNGAGPWDWCYDCDCANFLADGGCLTCHDKRYVEYGQHEVSCPECSR